MIFSIAAISAALSLGAVSTRVEPTQITFGDRASARIEVATLGKDNAPIENAKVKLTVSVGSFSSVKSVSAGHFQATYSPPAKHLPQIAIILVEIEGRGVREHRWLTLPLQARADLRIETKSRARLTVDVGDQRFGPITADHLGRASVKALIPPCVDAAMVHATDPAGNVSEKPLDLKPMPFPHAMVFIPTEHVSWADPEPTQIEVFALDASCKPVSSTAGVSLLTSAGTLDAPTLREKGVLTFPFRGPEDVGVGSAKLRIKVGTQTLPTEADVRVVSGPQNGYAIRFEPARFTAGSKTHVRISTRPVDAKGNVVAGGQQPERVVTDLGSLEGVPPAYTLMLPDQFQHREVAIVQAEGAAGSSSAQLELVPGPPSAIGWVTKPRFVRAGETLKAEVRVSDAFGNGVKQGISRASNAGWVAASLAAASTTTVEPLGDGRQRILSLIPDDATLGKRTLRVDAGSVEREEEILVGQYQRPWGFILGVTVGGQTNFARATAFVPRLNLGLHIARTPFELLLEGDLSLYRTVSTELASGSQTTSLASGSLAIGARSSLPVSSRWSVYASGVIGLDVVGSTLRLTSAGVSQSQSEGRATFLVRGAMGTSVAVGRGRFIGQLEGSWARARGQLSGNLGGLGLGIGYLHGF